MPRRAPSGLGSGAARFARELFAGASDARDVRRFRERNTTGRDDEDVIDADDVRSAFEMLRRELDPA